MNTMMRLVLACLGLLLMPVLPALASHPEFPQPGELYGWSTDVITVVDKYGDAKLNAKAKEQIDLFNTLRTAEMPLLAYQVGQPDCGPFRYDLADDVPDGELWLCFSNERFRNVGGTADSREIEDVEILAGVVWMHRFGGQVKGTSIVTCHEMMHLLMHVRGGGVNHHALPHDPSCLGNSASRFAAGDIELLAIAYPS